MTIILKRTPFFIVLGLLILAAGLIPTGRFGQLDTPLFLVPLSELAGNLVWSG